MTPLELSEILLSIVGITLQLVFKYAPRLSDWYQARPDKGVLMLIFVIIAGALYVGLSCTPFAGQLGIHIPCAEASFFTLARAIFIVASTQQLTYLFTRKK